MVPYVLSNFTDTTRWVVMVPVDFVDYFHKCKNQQKNKPTSALTIHLFSL